MLKHYLTIGIRNIFKYRVFSFINVFGLAIAMSVYMLLILMLADQKSYDQFHTKKERIYRILSDQPGSKAPNSLTAFPLASTLKADYEAVEASTRLTKGVGGDIAYGQKSVETRGYFADDNFFQVFSYALEKGNAASALVSPNSMVITSACARQLFNGEDPIGKTVDFSERGLPVAGDGQASPSASSWGSYTVTGVLAASDHKSHLKFDVLISASSHKSLADRSILADLTGNWREHACYTYVLLDSFKDKRDLNACLNDVVARQYTPHEDTRDYMLMAQALSEITPGIHVRNEPSYSMPVMAYYFLGFLALAIMLLACLNYTNLSTARALTRAKEIGVRKVTGAYRENLVYQFLSESVLTALLAMVMAIALLFFIKPAFKSLWINQYLNFSLEENVVVYVAFAAFAILTGIFAGVYPALYLSRYQPIKALKNTEGAAGKLGMRKALGVFQFVISLFLITTSILIYNQFRYFMEFEYGFNSKDIVNIALQGNSHEKVVNELIAIPGVAGISASDIVPATNTDNGISVRESSNDEKHIKFGIIQTDENFISNLDIPLVEGDDLPVAGPLSDRFVLVNESAVKALGYQYANDVIGRTLETPYDTIPMQVAGVIKDFHFKGPQAESTGPLLLRNKPATFNYVNVKIASGDLQGTLQRLERKWKAIDPVHSFKYEFYDEALAATHRGIFDVVSILGFIAFIAIVIACLGLLGMATYTAERKKKEVGIRKVLGAESGSIAFMLSKAFLKMLAISVCIGAPLSYSVNNLWLQKLPNRVAFGPGTVLTATLILLILGALTIASQTIKAAKVNPTEALKAS